MAPGLTRSRSIHIFKNKSFNRRFGCNVYNAEVPASKLREVSQDAKQRAHSEVNRLMARQRKRILGGGAADETASIVSSCSSFQIGGRGGGRMGVGGGSAAAEEEEQAEPPRYGLGCDIAIGGFASMSFYIDLSNPFDRHAFAFSSCCARWFYPLCFALAPASFHRYAREQVGGGRGRRGEGEVDDVASMISASFMLDLGDDGDEEDDDLLLWRSKPRRPGSLGLVGLGRGAGGGGGAFATGTML